MIVIVGLTVVIMAAWSLSTITKGVVALAEWRQHRRAGPHQQWYEPVTYRAPPAERTPGLGRLVLALVAVAATLIWMAHQSI